MVSNMFLIVVNLIVLHRSRKNVLFGPEIDFLEPNSVRAPKIGGGGGGEGEWIESLPWVFVLLRHSEINLL